MLLDFGGCEIGRREGQDDAPAGLDELASIREGGEAAAN
jgi:hypothetical protein